MPAAQQQVTIDFLSYLRQATAHQHKLLETTELSKNLLSESVTLKHYTDYLIKMQAVICFCEEQIFPHVETVVKDIQNRKKSALIKNDLLHFNIKPRNNHFNPPIQSTSIAYALGYIYVVEGSTLGGRLILKHIKNKLLVNEDNGGTFFAGYKQETGNLWKTFLQTLNNYVEETQSADEVVKGAQDAFSSIYFFFSKDKE